MSNEASIKSSLSIVAGNVQYSSKPTAFNADVTGRKGPCPGAFAVTTAGVDCDFSELTTPGLCRIVNLDPTNFVTFGIWDPEGARFYPLGEVLAGETYVLRLSRDIQEEYGTGTGTLGANTNRLRFKADTASVSVSVEAFEV